MRLGGRQASADFAETFGRLLDAAGLNPDKLVRELKKQGQPILVERATVYDWKSGQHLPGDEATFKAVVRVCLRQARQHGARAPLADKASWVQLLREARLSRESSRSLGPRAAQENARAAPRGRLVTGIRSRWEYIRPSAAIRCRLSCAGPMMISSMPRWIRMLGLVG